MLRSHPSANCISKIVAVAIIILVLVSNPVFSASQNSKSSHASIVSRDNQSIDLEFRLEDTALEQVVENGNNRSKFTMPDEGYTLEYGYPVLPAVTRVVVVPPAAGLSFSFQADEPRRVRAVNQPVICDEQAQGVNVDTDIAPLAGVYPPVVAEMSEPFVIRGARMVRVTTYPVRYDPQANVYLHYDNVQTQINFTNEEPVNPVRNPIRRNRSQEFLKFIRNFAMNGDEVGRDDPDRDAEPGYVGHYLVVIHQNCLQYAAPFIEWRRKSGWKVDILRVPSNQAGNPSTVRNLIRERYNAYLDDGIDPFDQVLLVGDHTDYQLQPQAQWVLASDRGNPIWPHNCNHNDWYYACLEGGNNDLSADVGIARWIAGSESTMRLFVNRTLSYEVTPYMEDTDWFTRGAIYAQRWGNNYHYSLATNVRFGKSVLEELGFDDIRVNENMDQIERQGEVVGPFLTRQFNDGVNVMMGRAENYYYRNSFQGVRANGIYPIDIDVAGHHEWSCWNMLRTGNHNNPTGPCAATTGWGGQATLPYSVIWLEIVNGFMLKDMTYGWAHIYGVLGPENYIPNFGQTYLACKTDVVFYGDPGIQYWRGVPLEVEAEFPGTISPSDRLIEVYVYDAENEEDLPGAQVTLYVPGNMPDFDEARYADYDEMYMISKKTGEDGFASFIIPEEIEFDEGTMHMTVSGRDILPFLEEIEIDNPNTGVELSGWDMEEVEGNEDDDVNPGEVFTINLTAHNISRNNAIEDVTATITSMSPYVEVAEENVISFGEIGANEDADGEAGVEISVSAHCPDAASRPITMPSLRVEFSDGDDSWETAVQLDVNAPNMVVNQVVGGMIIEDEMDNLNLVIRNDGRLRSPEMSVRLSSQGIGVNVVDPDAVLSNIAPNRTDRLEGEGFTITGSSLAVPGSKTDMILIFESEDGFVDTAYFELQTLEPRANAPQGPDGYGYICFDDTDEDWDIAPTYEWIEISRADDDFEFRGIEMEFRGNSPNNTGETIVLDLPFETQFYGRLYDQISVATNGFISMGDQEYITNYQNWPMDRAIGGGVGMLAPLWDDLNKGGNGDVYYFYDEENARFIVEWYRFRHRSGGNNDLTFQVILYDHEVWVTETGDQNILFQYKNVSDVRGRGGWANAAPYASVGISSPDGTTGLNYSYNNQRPVTSAPLANRRALLFTTAPKFRAGWIGGLVTDAETGEPVAEAIITTEHGFSAISDEDGQWRVLEALADVEFNITCIKAGYNDSSYVDLIVEEEDSLEINFDLLHPEFIPSVEELEAALPVGDAIELEFEISNTGNGPLNWHAEERLRGDANASPWELRRDYAVGQTLEDSRCQGVVFIDDHFYVAGSNDRNPQIYVLNREGELVDQYDQFGPGGGYGHKDLAYDGEWIWGSGSGDIYAFTPEGELMREFDGVYNPTNNFTWDSDRDVLWVSSTTSDISGIDRDGNIIGTLERMAMRIYGLAYWPDDPDGYTLYIFHKERDVGDQIITKMNPENNDTMFVNVLEPEEGGTPLGAFCTNQFDVYSWVFMGVSNDGAADRVDVWQLDARRDWFELNPNTGVIDPDETQDFVLTLDATGLPEDITFEAELRFYHNATGGVFNLLIALEVLGGERSLELDLTEGWNMISINAEPENLDIREMLSPLTEEDRVVIFKNGIGQFYLPEMNFCNIERWEISDGYQINLTEASQWEVRGAPVAEDQPIELVEGWNLKAYFPTEPVDAVTALAGIAESLVIAKDGIGRFYLAEFGFSNLGDLAEGQGYQYKMNEPVELIYQIGEEVAANEPTVSTLQHFESLTPTGADMSVLLICDQQMTGSEIGVFTSGGRLAGSGIIETNGYCGIAVWGDDISTDEVDGARAGEVLTFRLWDGNEESDLIIAVHSGKTIWSDGDILIGEIGLENATPATFGIHETYPNPTNGPVRLSFGMENDVVVSLNIYDLSGRLVTTLAQGEYKAGYHQITWNTDAVSSGLYLAKMVAPGRSHTEKIAVLK